MKDLATRTTSNCLFVVDLSGYVFRAYHAFTPLSAPDGEPTHATLGTVNMLYRLIDERKPELMSVAMDTPVGSFRRRIDPNYKANRPPPPPDLSIQMTRVRQLVELMGMDVWQRDEFEADDLIASGAKKAVDAGLEVVIVSADKDMMQLVDDKVCVWDSMRDKLYDPSGVFEKFGVRPDQMHDYLCLLGDSSDNIKGVPSVGAKTAAKLLAQYDNIDGIYQHIDALKGKLKENLLASRDVLALASQLVTLRSDIEFPFARERLEYQRHEDATGLQRIYRELGFSRLLQRLCQTAVHADIPESSRPSPDAAVAYLGEGASVALSAPAVASESDVDYCAVMDVDTLDAVVRACVDAGFVAVDTETDCLDAMRARLVGISLSVGEKQGWYIPVHHLYLGAPQQIPIEQVRERLAGVFANSAVRIVGHNLKFDEVVLRRHGFGPLTSMASDTMLESYLIDPEARHGLKDLALSELGVTMTSFEQVVGGKGNARGAGRSTTKTARTFDQVSIDDAVAYACADADCCLRLHNLQYARVQQQGMQKLLESVEVPLSQVLVDMEMAGVLVDVAQLHALDRTLTTRMQQLEALAKKQAGRDFNVHAPRQLETILFDELKLPVKKRTAKARSTDAAVLEALADAHPLVSTILSLRQVAKLHNTYVATLPTLVNPSTKRIHTRFNQTVTATGRLSSSDPNLQNIPVRTEEGREIRKAFVAPEGFVLVSADYSQVELRVLAHLSQDPVLLHAFQTGEDIHTRTAMEVFGVDEQHVSKDQRRQAKTINFGVIYGIGDLALSKRLGVERAQARSFIDRYFERYQGVRQFMDRTLEQAKQTKVVRTLLARQRRVEDIDSTNGMLRSQAQRIAGNTPIQGTAADILKLAMLRLNQAVVPGARMILTVHDELVFEVPRELVDEATVRIREAMESVLPLSVPLVVDIGVGDNWADAH